MSAFTFKTLRMRKLGIRGQANHCRFWEPAKMKLIHLHDINNPSQRIPMDAEDFSVAVPYGTGSSVRLKSSDQPIACHEDPDTVEQIVSDALSA